MFYNFNISFAIIVLLQGVSANLYKGERNAMKSVSVERLKCTHRSAQKLCANSTVVLAHVCSIGFYMCANYSLKRSVNTMCAH